MYRNLNLIITLKRGGGKEKNNSKVHGVVSPHIHRACKPSQVVYSQYACYHGDI